MTLVKNKIVDCAALLDSLNKKFVGNLEADFYSKEDIEIAVDEYIKEHVEQVAYEQADLSYLHSNIIIDNVIDNMNEFRDTQHDFCNELAEKLFN